MRYYSSASESKELPKTEEGRPGKATLYDWALGRRPSGVPQQSCRVHATPRCELTHTRWQDDRGEDT